MNIPANVTLIGMPGSGKSTVGRLLARRWRYDFLDTDALIEAREQKTLEQIIAEIGREWFLHLESQTIQSLQVNHSLIATGGSVVYDDAAMAHLRQISRVIYLEVSLEEIERRIGDLSVRGVIIAPGKTVADLWIERDPLYRRYAHLIVSNNGEDSAASAAQVAAAVEATGS